MLPFADNLFETRSEPCFPSPSAEAFVVDAVFGLPNIQKKNITFSNNIS
jgi:hypothetical protein